MKSKALQEAVATNVIPLTVCDFCGTPATVFKELLIISIDIQVLPSLRSVYDKYIGFNMNNELSNEFMNTTIQTVIIVIAINNYNIINETIDKCNKYQTKTFLFLFRLKILSVLIFSVKLLDEHCNFKYFYTFTKNIQGSKMQHHTSILNVTTYNGIIVTMNRIVIQSITKIYIYYYSIINLLIAFYAFQIHMKYLHNVKFYQNYILCGVQCSHTIYIKNNFMLIIIAHVCNTSNSYLLNGEKRAIKKITTAYALHLQTVLLVQMYVINKYHTKIIIICNLNNKYLCQNFSCSCWYELGFIKNISHCTRRTFVFFRTAQATQTKMQKKM